MRSKYIVIEGLEGAGKTTARNVVVFEDADFGIQAARAAGMDAVDVRLL